MPAAVLAIRYTLADLQELVLENAPDDAAVRVYRTENGDGEPEYLMMVQLPAASADAVSWIPYAWSATSGDRITLWIDHATLLDIALLHARDVAAQLRVETTGEAQAWWTRTAEGQPVVEVLFPVQPAPAASSTGRAAGFAI